ncbi:hypothetical protein HMPREF1548_00329 [Clostridium sp. KLE 1755]|nr:hypothetical protein HMPREF1548_00329 [Clostridium sp. KLE 1755]
MKYPAGRYRHNAIGTSGGGGCLRVMGALRAGLLAAGVKVG